MVPCIALFHLILLLFHLLPSLAENFMYTGFKQASNLTMDGLARITQDGVLQLTNDTAGMGHTFFSSPVLMLESQYNTSKTVSFSTIFVFDIITDVSAGGHGLTFAISPSKILPGAEDMIYLGLLGKNNNGNFSNHIFAVEFDTAETSSFNDIDSNHVGVDINSLVSSISKTATYYANSPTNVTNVVKLQSGQPIQAWIDYNGTSKVLDVTIAPVPVPKPSRPLISYSTNLTPIFNEQMYVGFTAATGEKLASSHYILAWSFATNAIAQAIDLSKLPKYPRAPRTTSDSKSPVIKFALLSSVATFAFIVIMISIFLYLRQRAKLAETLEDWELDHPHRFPYKDLYRATKGFKETELLGSGGFGQVYKGVLLHTKEELAIKKISSNTKQGIREFVAEISSLGRMRHRNLVELRGWCKRNEDLLLVYEFMTNGSLDMHLYNHNKNILLSWEQRLNILRGVASGLLYLHEEWEQVVVHRDVKPGNVLLGSDMNPKLGDFGLARLYEHGTNPHTTHVVGTLGYMAPELSCTGKATTSSDVFAFGVLLLEVACGRRPVEPNVTSSEVNLVEWVRDCEVNGELMKVVDPNLGWQYNEEEMKMVLKLGLVCCQSIPEVRPNMRQVSQYLNGNEQLGDDLALVFLDVDSVHSAFRNSFPWTYGSVSTSSFQGGR